MIIKFTIFENNIISDNYQILIDKIKAVLSPDLLRGIWNKEQHNTLKGHCYSSTEALYWMLGGPDSEWKTYVLSNKTWPEVLNQGETHWFLKNNKGVVLDPTAEQFNYKIPYERGVANYMMNHPYGGSKRAKEIIRRVSSL